MKKIIGILLFCGVALFLLIQLVPYGRNHQNPPVIQEPAWPDAGTRVIAQCACFDCHSNETIWAWYSNIAPISWLVQRDVEKGRSQLNFSEWGRAEQEIDEIGEVIQEGEMPPFQYTLIHPGVRLSADERETLIRGLAAININLVESNEDDED